MTSDRKTVIITGGNSGIGFETAKVFAKKGWRVVITGRDDEKLEQALVKINAAAEPASNCELAYRIGDYASFESVRALAAKLNTEQRIDVLINNAGIALSSHQLSSDGNDMMLQVNHLSHFLLTNLLIDKLKASKPARIVNISSRLHRLAFNHGFDDIQMENNFRTLKVYGLTKLYTILFTRELARRIEGSGVTVNALHPGSIFTNIGQFEGVLKYVWPIVRVFQKPQFFGARVPVYVAVAPEIEGITGEYFSSGLKAVPVSRLAQDPRAAKRLWDISAELTHLDAD